MLSVLVVFFENWAHIYGRDVAVFDDDVAVDDRVFRPLWGTEDY